MAQLVSMPTPVWYDTRVRRDFRQSYSCRTHNSLGKSSNRYKYNTCRAVRTDQAGQAFVHSPVWTEQRT